MTTETNELCPHCIAIRGGARRLRQEIIGHKGAYAKLKAENAKLQAELDALKLANAKTLIRYNVGPGVTQARISLAKRLRASGYRVSEIAVLMDYSRQRVHQWLVDDAHKRERELVRRKEVSENLTLEASEKLKLLNSLSGTDNAL